MKNSIKISHNTNSIIITKAFERKASIYNSEEYKELLAVQKDFPTYKVVVNQVSKKTSRKSKITLEDMRRYILAHDNKEKSIMAEFNKMTQKKKESGELITKTFFEVKKWFYGTFKELQDKKENTKEVA